MDGALLNRLSASLKRLICYLFTLYPCAAATHDIIGFLISYEVPVVADGVTQCGICPCKVDDLLLGFAFQHAPDQCRSKAVAATDAIVDLDIVILTGYKIAIFLSS